jgi:hypothetical protein
MVPEGGSDDLAPKLFPKPNDAIFGSGRNFVYDLRCEQKRSQVLAIPIDFRFQFGKNFLSLHTTTGRGYMFGMNQVDRFVEGRYAVVGRQVSGVR